MEKRSGNCKCVKFKKKVEHEDMKGVDVLVACEALENVCELLHANEKDSAYFVALEALSRLREKDGKKIKRG